MRQSTDHEAHYAGITGARTSDFETVFKFDDCVGIWGCADKKEGCAKGQGRKNGKKSKGKIKKATSGMDENPEYR